MPPEAWERVKRTGGGQFSAISDRATGEAGGVWALLACGGGPGLECMKREFRWVLIMDNVMSPRRRLSISGNRMLDRSIYLPC